MFIMKYMKYSYIAITLNLILLHIYLVESDTSQEKARIVYANPKYVTEVKAFTARQGRSSIYVTNVTGTTFHTWGNNITFILKYSLKASTDSFYLPVRLCEAFNIVWVKDIVRYSAATNLLCPFPAGFYAFYNIELPPKNFPFQLQKGSYTLGIIFQSTATKEKFFELSGVIHIK